MNSPDEAPGGHEVADQSALDTLVGPFYNRSGVSRLLGVPQEEVDERRHARTLISVQTADGIWIFPTFQFRGRDTYPALSQASVALAEAPRWSAALWFVTSNPDLDGSTPLDWARRGESTARLLQSAKASNSDFR